MAAANMTAASRTSTSKNIALGVLVTGLAVSLSACSSGSSVGEPLGSGVASAAPPTSAPSTSATQTTIAAEVSDAQARYYASYAQAFAKPGSVGATQGLLALYVPASPARKQMVQRLASFVRQGWAARPGKAGYYVIERVTPDDGSSATRATTRVCTYDDGVVYDATRTAPDGSRIVIDDSVESALTTFRWARTDSGWKLQGGAVTTTWKGVNRCPPH